MIKNKFYILVWFGLVWFVVLFTVFTLIATNPMEKDKNVNIISDNDDFRVEIDKDDDKQVIFN